MEEKKQCTCCESREKKSTQLTEKEAEQVSGGWKTYGSYDCRNCGRVSTNYYTCSRCGEPLNYR